MRPDGRQRPPAPTTVAGTVSAGVEGGCLLLGGYQLLGAARAQLRPGQRVRVTGHPRPDLLTTAQQGTPFVVTAVEELDG